MARSCAVAVTLAFLLAGSGIVWAGAAEEGGVSESAATVAEGVYRESPMLAALVAAGELPAGGTSGCRWSRRLSSRWTR